MADITHGTWIKDGKAVDSVYQNGVQVYGRNLLLNTSNELKTITNSGWGNSTSYYASGKYGAGRYYASAYIENTTSVGMKLYVGVYTDDGKFLYNALGGFMPAGKSGIVSSTINISEGQFITLAFVGFEKSQTESYTYKYKEIMITRTPISWSPAPEDILN